MTDAAPLTEKTAIIARLDAAHAAFDAALRRVPQEQLDQPGLWGEWTLKDLVAHIAFWHRVGLERLQKFGVGEWDAVTWYDDAEDVNATVYRSNKDQPAAAILETYATTFLAFRTAVRTLPAAVYAEQQGPMSLAQIVAGDGYDHEEEHLADIERATSPTG